MNDKKIKVLEMIAEDMENDAKNFDGQPFTGKTVAKYFGNQGAAIAALANIVRSILEKDASQQTVEADAKKTVLDGSFPCPECGFNEKHFSKCSRR